MNDSTNDAIYVSCDKSFDAGIELWLLAIQWIYLVPMIVLNIRIIFTILVTNRSIYGHSSYYQLFAVDIAITCIPMTLSALFHRPLIFIPQLCETVVAYFARPSFWVKFAYILTIYARTFTIVFQVFNTFNRMICVIWPFQYEAAWKRLLFPVYFFLFTPPLLAIYNILISRVFLMPVFGGISFNYVKLTSWASLSGITFGFIVVSVTLSSIFSIITLRGLVRLANRVKTTERTLCITSAAMTIGLLVSAFLQLLIALRSTSLTSWIPSRHVFMLSVLATDFLYVWTPLTMVYLNRPFRDHLIGRKYTDQHQTANTIFIG